MEEDDDGIKDIGLGKGEQIGGGEGQEDHQSRKNAGGGFPRNRHQGTIAAKPHSGGRFEVFRAPKLISFAGSAE